MNPAIDTGAARGCEHGAASNRGVRAAGRRDHGRDPPGRPGRLQRGQGHARGDVTGQQLPAVLQRQPALGRDRGPADLPQPDAGQRGAAGRGERRGGRRGQLRAARGRPAHGRGRVRRGRPHAPQGHRHPAARAPGLAGPEPPDQHVHGRDPVRQPGHAARLRRRRPAGAAPLRRGRHRADLPAARPGRPGPRQLPGRRGRAGAQRGRGQPAAHLRARVGRGDRREPAPRHGGPGHPGQHQGRRVRAAGSTW